MELIFADMLKASVSSNIGLLSGGRSLLFVQNHLSITFPKGRKDSLILLAKNFQERKNT
jgi:hypothetical protein